MLPGPPAPAAPRAKERRLSRESAGEPGTQARTPPGTAAASLPPSPSRVPSPLPTPTLGGGVSCHPLRVPPDLKDLTVAGIPGTINLPLPPQTKAEPSNRRLPKP